ncbi:MAG: MMPL family transporter [Pseudomonadota bacterium]|nr:MMPL family transporter [Pseudomonadota bacterium]MDP1903230.1 MMPL family transporter [Pseudomonadota bacterium]MDP2352739.1 MMPL family transporter [Pseudomonadota bacterium]
MRLRAWIWLACAALLLAATVARFVPEPPIETDLLALLPPTERNPLAEQAATRLGRLTGERAVFLIGLPDTKTNGADARAAASLLATRLDNGQVFKKIVTRIPTPDPSALLDLYTPYRGGLIAPELRDETFSPDNLSARLDARLASPFGGGALPLAADPFGLFDAWLQSLPYQQFRLTVEDGWLSLREGGNSGGNSGGKSGEMTWVLVSGELAGSAFDPVVQQGLQASLPAAEEELKRRWPGIQVLRAGAVFHATAARASAEREMHVIGVGSLLGIILLLLLVYRSPGPLALGLLSVGVGVCVAVLTTTWVFGRLHLMTLVFGASLIGEAIDYAIQYFSARLGAGSEWDARRGLATVFPALAVALATSVVGYAALALTPFPAMRQIAVFAISGLAAAWLTVLLVLPWWLRRAQTWTPGRLLEMPGRWLHLWRTRVGQRAFLIFAAVALLVAAPGWLRLTADDDIRQLIQSPADLTAQERQLRTLTGLEAGSQFFLIEGDSPEQVLQREEALAEKLARQGVKMQGVSRFIPSCRKQKQDRQRLRDALPTARQTLEDAGFRAEAIADWSGQVSRPGDCLAPQAWLESPLSTPFRHLWLGRTAQGVASLALPSGYREVAMLTAASRSLPGVTLVDKPGAVSRLFAEYRRLGIYVLAAATLLIFTVLAWRYGPRGAAAVLAPVLLAQALALALLGYAGVVLNLFNLLALLLVLGVGINYAIFLFEGTRALGPQPASREAATLVGVTLSAATTLLSFGLLSLSSMPALSGFGITLALGVGIAVLLAPAVLVLTKHAPGHPENPR